jgi:rare lipoprotein A
MTIYQVQKGDTIAAITKQLNTNWKDLHRNNPESIGKSSVNGNWFLKEGATISTGNSFQESLQDATQQQTMVKTTPPLSIPRSHSKILFPVPPTTATVPEQQQDKPSEFIEHTLQAGETLWELAVDKYHVNLSDILKDNSITNPRSLQIGQKIMIRIPEKGGEEPVVASWYGKDFHGKPMANGDIYDMNAATIAHKEMPLGTRVELTNTKTGEIVQAVVTDRGPYIAGRDVDLSYGLAKRLSLVEQGVGNLVMRVL